MLWELSVSEKRYGAAVPEVRWLPSCPEGISGSSALRVRGKRQLSVDGSVMCFIRSACGCRPRRSGTSA
jgi:hypothetical protein